MSKFKRAKGSTFVIEINRMHIKRNIIINLVLVIIATILLFGGSLSDCLNYGYGLGDVAYLFPLWCFSLLYVVLMIILRKHYFKTLIPAILFGLILSGFISTLIFDRGPECSCHPFSKFSSLDIRTEKVE